MKGFRRGCLCVIPDVDRECPLKALAAASLLDGVDALTNIIASKKLSLGTVNIDTNNTTNVLPRSMRAGHHDIAELMCESVILARKWHVAYRIVISLPVKTL